MTVDIFSADFSTPGILNNKTHGCMLQSQINLSFIKSIEFDTLLGTSPRFYYNHDFSDLEHSWCSVIIVENIKSQKQ